MEAIGIAASFIAIAQALLAGRHVVNLLQEIPKIGTELASLNNEIESLRAAVEAANTQGMAFHDNEIEGPDLRLARGQITHIANKLEKVRLKCTQVGQNGKIKPRMTRWFLMQKELQVCRDKARDARSALHLALATLNLKSTVQMSLHIERFTLRSTSYHDSRPDSDCETNASQGDDSLSSASALGSGFKNEENHAISGQEVETKMRQLSLLSADGRPSDEKKVLGMDMVVFEARLSGAENQGLVAVQGSMQARGYLFPDDRDAVGNDIMSSAMQWSTPETLEFMVKLWAEHLRRGTYHTNWFFTANRVLRRPDHSAQEKEAFRLIASFGEDIVDAAQTKLHEAVESNEPTTIEYDIQSIVARYPWIIDQWNREGHTPLTLAAQNGNLRAVKELVRLGCNIDQSDFEGATALMVASTNGHVDIMNYLLDVGCSVNATTICGETALHLASNPDIQTKADPGTIMEILLSAGASANSLCLRGHTPLHVLGVSGSVKFTRGAAMTMTRLLLDAGADINAMTHMKERPLQRTFFQDQPEVMKCLIEAGAQVTDLMGKESLLHVAAKYARLEALQYLEDMRFPLLNVHQEDEWGDTPWDDFMMVIYKPEWDLGSWRKPNFQERDAFVALYKKLRDRSLELDISRLQRIRQHLQDELLRGATTVLESLISEKRDWAQWDSVQTYETIKLQVRERMIEAALESVDENIEVLQEKIDASPWDQVSYWDPPEAEDSDDLEDYTESGWTEAENDPDNESNEAEVDAAESPNDDDRGYGEQDDSSSDALAET